MIIRFTAIDGSQPDTGGQFDFEQYFARTARTGFLWKIMRRTKANGM
jgi:hypothetical protein